MQKTCRRKRCFSAVHPEPKHYMTSETCIFLDRVQGQMGKTCIHPKVPTIDTTDRDFRLDGQVNIGHRPLNGLTCDWLLKIQKIYGQHAHI